MPSSSVEAARVRVALVRAMPGSELVRGTVGRPPAAPLPLVPLMASVGGLLWSPGAPSGACGARCAAGSRQGQQARRLLLQQRAQLRAARRCTAGGLCALPRQPARWSRAADGWADSGGRRHGRKPAARGEGVQRAGPALLACTPPREAASGTPESPARFAVAVNLGAQAAEAVVVQLSTGAHPRLESEWKAVCSSCSCKCQLLVLPAGFDGPQYPTAYVATSGALSSHRL